MEKEIDRKTVVLQEDENVGSVKIADDVVATIARLAANEVEVVDLAVVLAYGYNIPATCSKVQAKVKSAVENMTGLTCSDVNIRIAGVKVN